MIRLCKVVLLLAVIFPVVLTGGEFYHDLRGDQLPPALHLFGRGAGKTTRPESRGLRVYLPASRGEKAGPIGLSPAFSLEGDFEVTATYEILKADKPTSGPGSGVNLRFVVGNPLQEGTGLARYLRPNGQDVYYVSRSTMQDDGKPKNKMKTFPTTSKAGKLRMKRAGSTISYQVADGSSNEFRELMQDEFVSEKCVVRLAVSTGGSPTDLDVRLVDLRITAEELPTGRITGEESGGWVLPVLLGVAAVALAGLGFYWWRRRRSTETD